MRNRLHRIVEADARNNSTSRAWCFTINNPTNDTWDQLRLLDGAVRRMRAQLERGDTGTYHIQGYLEWQNSKRFTGTKSLLPHGAHVERRRGTANEAWEYCKKDTEGVRTACAIEFGTPPTGPGTRSDIENLSAFISNGATSLDVANTHPGMYIRYKNGINGLIHILSKPYIGRKKVHLYYGKTNTGKTRTAMSQHKDAYWFPIQMAKTLWFDGYIGQKVIIFDEFEGQIALNSLLRILDRYPCQVPIKNGYVQLQANKIILTSNSSIDMWYDYSKRPEKYNALVRRFTRILKFTGSEVIMEK